MRIHVMSAQLKLLVCAPLQNYHDLRCPRMKILAIADCIGQQKPILDWINFPHDIRILEESNVNFSTNVMSGYVYLDIPRENGFICKQWRTWSDEA